MTNQTRLLGALLAAGLAVSLPVAALAQQPPGKQAPARAAPHAAPAPRAAPAPHMAPAPHAAAPHFAPAARMAPPRAAPPARVATPRFTPQQHAAPHIQSAPAINRSVAAAAIPAGARIAPAKRPVDRSDKVQLASAAKRPVPAASAAQYASAATRRARIAPERRPAIAPLASLATGATREQIQQSRQQRALSRQQLAQPNSLQTQSNARTLRANRRNGAPAPDSRRRTARAFCLALCAAEWRPQLAKPI